MPYLAKRPETRHSMVTMRQYLDLMAHVLETGVRKEDRTGTGTGTLSVFGYQMRCFTLGENRPPAQDSGIRVAWSNVREARYQKFAAELVGFANSHRNQRISTSQHETP